MSKPKFVPNVRGFNQVMKSQPVRGELKHIGNQVAADAGEGFEAVVDTRHPWMDRVYVQPATPAAHRRNARDQLIMRAAGKRIV